MTNPPTVARHLADTLASHGVTHVFELIGGMIATLLDELHRTPDIQVVSMHHEQAAGFAAEGFARCTGGFGVALATSGPGATNLVTAMGSCYFDSVPVLFITGQVNVEEIHEHGRGRQLGFQETDIVSIAAPITKAAIQVRDPDEFPATLQRAIALATEGRPGPVLLDIPMDVQSAVISSDSLGLPPPSTNAGASEVSKVGDVPNIEAFLDVVLPALGRSKRPLILAGGGIRSSGSTVAFRDFVERTGIPVVQSLMGLDSYAGESPIRVGFIGSYGNRWANWALGESDLLLVLGSRLDIRQTGSDIAGFIGDRKIFHVDIDNGELNNRVAASATLQSDLKRFFGVADKRMGRLRHQWDDWIRAIESRQAEWPDVRENVPKGGINPNELIRDLSLAWRDVDVWVTDVGQHQMWAAQSLLVRPHQRFLTSGGMGSMGFGLPAAIGAALARKGSVVGLIAGDGGFQCNIQELQTVKRLGLDVRIVVLNNQCHGMVRQFQESYFDGRYTSTVLGYSAPSFKHIGLAYGIKSQYFAESSQLLPHLSGAESAQGPLLMEVAIEQDLKAYPKMAFGQPYGSMEPQVRSIQMEST